MKTILFFVLSFTSLPVLNYAQEFKVSMYYLDGEKSKDSHSTEERFTVNGYDVSYTVKYSGHKTKNHVDMDKTCTFTEQDITNIKYAITKQGLNVNGEAIDKSSKYKSFEIYCNISLDITMDGSEYKIRVNGEVSSLEDNDLYKSCDYFAKLLRRMCKDCK